VSKEWEKLILLEKVVRGFRRGREDSLGKL
jgi:hypothetical protein